MLRRLDKSNDKRERLSGRNCLVKNLENRHRNDFLKINVIFRQKMA